MEPLVHFFTHTHTRTLERGARTVNHCQSEWRRGRRRSLESSQCGKPEANGSCVLGLSLMLWSHFSALRPLMWFSGVCEGEKYNFLEIYGRVKHPKREEGRRETEHKYLWIASEREHVSASCVCVCVCDSSSFCVWKLIASRDRKWHVRPLPLRWPWHTHTHTLHRGHEHTWRGSRAAGNTCVFCSCSKLRHVASHLPPLVSGVWPLRLAVCQEVIPHRSRWD